MTEFTAENTPSASSNQTGTMSEHNDASVKNTTTEHTARQAGLTGADGNAAVQTETKRSKPRIEKAAGDTAVSKESAQKSADGEHGELSRTQAFSKRLNEMSEKKAKEAQDELRKQYEGHETLLDALKKKGYEGSASEIAQLLLSEAGGTEESEYGADESADMQQPGAFPEHHLAALQWARDIIDERTFEQDLAAIKAAYPDVSENSVWELGDIYIQLMLSGAVDSVTAYEAQRSHNGRKSRPAPPSIGPAKSGGLAPDKEFYTPDEVERLTAADYEDPKVMKRVRRSMTLWK